VGLRETINKNPKPTAAVAAGIVLVAIALIVYNTSGDGGEAELRPAPTKAYFSIDEGKTTFVADVTNIPPFKKDGKDAVRAIVYTCPDDGKEFVGRLESFAPKDKALVEAAVKKAGGTPDAVRQELYIATKLMMVKKPGDPRWVTQATAGVEDYARIMNPRCPDGSLNALLKTPDE
jgi:hypothetical protein